MPARPHLSELSRRERQIMDIIYLLGRATVVEVMEHLPAELGNSTVRKQLNILEEKGFLRHEKRKNSNVYLPTIRAESAGSSAMKHLLETFFQGSVSRAFVTMVDVMGGRLNDQDREKIARLIEESREGGR